MAAPQAVEPVTPEESTRSDEFLIERLRGGDEAAFELLYERYFKRVVSYVGKRIDNRADVEETVQEVFINLFSSIDSYRGDAPFVAWVFGLTRRTIANRYKKKRHPTVSLGDLEPEDLAPVSPALAAPDPSPLESYECNEALVRLETALTQRLSREQRRLFELHHIEHRPISEIATTLHKSEDAVKSNLYRARKLLLAT